MSIQAANIQFDVFLSHNSKDKSAVREIKQRLCALKLAVWLDEDELRPGIPWQQLLESGVKSSGSVAVLVGKDGLGPWEDEEMQGALRLAVKDKRPVIPVLLPDAPGEPELPMFLGNRSWVDLRKGLTKEGLGKLVWGITGQKPKPQVGLSEPPGATPLSPPRNASGSGCKPSAAPPRKIRTRIKKPAIDVIVPNREIVVCEGKYVLISGGTFPMGSDEGYPHERPRHPVEVSSFFLAANPVTNRLFSEFVNETGYRTTIERDGQGMCLRGRLWVRDAKANFEHPLGSESDVLDKKDHPVVQVSWFDAWAFCRWLSDRSGLLLALPFEAEWEMAAAGQEGRKWAYGDAYSRTMANTDGSGTTPVGRYLPNRNGLDDMTGNVYEWCKDWYAANWSAAGHDIEEGATKDPRGPSEGSERVLRGGSWYDTDRDSRCANRFKAPPFLAAANWGFRVKLRIDNPLIAALGRSSKWDLALGPSGSGENLVKGKRHE